MTTITARKTYKFILRPNKSQIKLIDQQLDLCRELYNAALQERRDAYKMAGKSISYYDQQNQLPAIKEVRPDLNAVYAQVLQDVLRRVQKAFDGFFRRIKQRASKVGYPRFQGRNRYDSLTYPQGGWSLHNDKLTLSKLGTIKIKLHRDVIGKVKTCTVKREAGNRYFVCLNVEQEFEPLVTIGEPVGIDVGLEFFASLSTGEQVANPRYFRKSEKRLAKAQRKAAKVKHLSRFDPSKRKALKAVSTCHRKVTNKRQSFLHQLSHRLATTHSLIVVEDLNITRMTKRAKPVLDASTGQYLPNGASSKSGLNKSIQDAGWATFISMVSYKAAWAGSKLLKVDPAHTSQICPDCGQLAKKLLSVRQHGCDCGCVMPRDLASAIVILGRGLTSISNQSVNAPGFSRGD